MLKLFCVLRSGGGEYRIEHVERLSDYLRKHLPGLQLHCLSNVAVSQPTAEWIELAYDWPGWWAKMELFRPDIFGDILFFDLDTVIVRDISHYQDVARTTMLSEFYSPTYPASGMMYLAQEDRAAIWESWMRDPPAAIRRHARGGDQKFLAEHKFIRCADRWQTRFPGEVISYKAHIRPDGRNELPLPENARVICFHGSPRPWQIGAQWTRP